MKKCSLILIALLFVFGCVTLPKVPLGDTIVVYKGDIEHIVMQSYHGDDEMGLMIFWIDNEEDNPRFSEGINNTADRVELRLSSITDGFSLPFVILFDTTDDGLIDAVYAIKTSDTDKIWGNKITLFRVDSDAIGVPIADIDPLNCEYGIKD